MPHAHLEKKPGNPDERIKSGVLSYDPDTGVVRKGDGVSRWDELPVFNGPIPINYLPFPTNEWRGVFLRVDEGGGLENLYVCLANPSTIPPSNWVKISDNQ